MSEFERPPSTKKSTKLLILKEKKVIYFDECKVIVTPYELSLVLKVGETKVFTFNRKYFVKEKFLFINDNIGKCDYIIMFSKLSMCKKIKDYFSQNIFNVTTNRTLEEQKEFFEINFFVPIVEEIGRKVAKENELKAAIFKLLNKFTAELKNYFLSLLAQILLSPDVEKAAEKVSIIQANDDVVIKKEEIPDTSTDHYICLQDGCNRGRNCNGNHDEASETGNGQNKSRKRSVICIEISDNEEDSHHNEDIDDGLHENCDDNDDGETESENHAGRKRLRERSESKIFDDEEGSREDADGDLNDNDDGETKAENYSGRKRLRERKKNISYIEDDEDSRYNEESDEDLYQNDYDSDEEAGEEPPAKRRKSNEEKYQERNRKSGKSSSLESLEYELYEYTENKKIKKKLVIFTSNNRDQCYEYTFYKGHSHYQCRKCNPKEHYVYAKAAVDDDTGDIELIFGKNEHVCQPIDYGAENYQSTKIIKLPDYKLIEKPANLKRANQRMIIFADKHQKKCYQYTLTQKGFQCMACIRLGRYVAAKLHKDSKNGDYLELSRAAHICEPEKYLDGEESVKTIHKPYYRIIREESGKGNQKKTLKIFDQNDRTMFYIYHYSRASSCFICSGCTKIKPHRQVCAKVCRRGENNEESYIQLSGKKHVCTMKKN